MKEKRGTTYARKRAEAISYNSVSETENDLDFRTAEPDGQNRIDNP